MTEDRDCDHPPSGFSASTTATTDSSPEERYRKIFQHNNDALIIVDLGTESFLDVNPAACDSTNCPVGIALQREDLRNRLVIDSAADGLQNFFEATVELMKVMARAWGHDSLSGFERRDLTTWKQDIADLTGVEYAGVTEP